MRSLRAVKNTTSATTYGLPAPYVTQAGPIDGLLPVTSLHEAVTLSLRLWEEILPGDTYQLLWDGVPTGLSRTIGSETAGTLVTLDIHAQLLIEDGRYEASYRARSMVGGIFTDSMSVPLIVDRTPPGGNLLAPLIFGDPLAPLTQEALDAVGGVLTGKLAGYYDAQWGDVIRSQWGGKPGPTHTVKAEELGGNAILFNFDSSFLHALSDGDVQVTYTVTDRAGNVSRVSEPALLRLQLQHRPLALKAPIVPLAADGVIDDMDARAAVQVHLPHYTPAQAGDLLSVSWGGLTLPAHSLSGANLTQDMVATVTVHHATVIAAGEGPIAVVYQVHRDGQLLGISPATLVQVAAVLPGPQDPQPGTPANENLPAPLIKGKSQNINRQDNWLDEDDYLLNADAVVAWHPDFKACDNLHLYWGSWPIAVQRIINENDVQAASDLVICVPNRLISGEGVCRAIAVRYTLSRQGNPNIAHSLTQSVRVVNRAQLPGGEAGLSAAVFVEVDAGNNLTLPRRDEGTLLLIRPYRNMKTGDRIRLHFKVFNAFIGGDPISDATCDFDMQVNEADLLDGCSVLIPDKHLSSVAVGRADVYYQIENSCGIAHSLTADAYIDRRTPAANCATY